MEKEPIMPESKPNKETGGSNLRNGENLEKLSESRFDPEKEISREDWGEMKEEVEANKGFILQSEENRFEIEEAGFDSGLNSDYARNCLNTAMNMKILFPERSEEIPINEDDWVEIEKQFGEMEVRNFLHIFAALKILFPQEVAQHEILKDQAGWRKIRRWVNSAGVGDQIEQIKNAMIVSPEEAAKLGPAEDFIDPPEAGSIEEAEDAVDAIDSPLLPKNEPHLYTEIIKGMIHYKKEKRWSNFAHEASRLRILIPEIARRLKVSEATLEEDLNAHLDDNAWQGMREELGRLRKGEYLGSWHHFAHLAAAMKMLAAKKVEVSNKGLEITMPRLNK